MKPYARDSPTRGLATDSLARAVVTGRFGTLLVETMRQIPERIVATSGQITLGKLADPKVDDLLDDQGEKTLGRGGQVVVMPAERVPSHTGIAAIYP